MTVMHRSQSQDTGLRGKTAPGAPRHTHCRHRPLLSSSNRVPGHAALKRESVPSATSSEGEKTLHAGERKRTGSSPSSPKRHGSRSRESSPRQHAGSTSSCEEIPLEDLSRIHSTRLNSPSIRRRSASGLPQVLYFSL